MGNALSKRFSNGVRVLVRLDMAAGFAATGGVVAMDDVALT